MGLELDVKTARIIEGITRESRRAPHELLGQLTEVVFFDLLSTKRDILEILNQYVKKRSSYYPERMLEGMAFTLGTFNVETESDLMIRLSELPSGTNYLANISQTLESIPVVVGDTNTTTIDRLLSLPTIPDHQTSLRGLMAELKERNPFSFDNRFFEGATIMYKVLGNLWPILYPPQSPAANPPSPPTNLSS